MIRPSIAQRKDGLRIETLFRADDRGPAPLPARRIPWAAVCAARTQRRRGGFHHALIRVAAGEQFIARRSAPAIPISAGFKPRNGGSASAKVASALLLSTRFTPFDETKVIAPSRVFRSS